jgi:hypothetical protein
MPAFFEKAPTAKEVKIPEPKTLRFHILVRSKNIRTLFLDKLCKGE